MKIFLPIFLNRLIDASTLVFSNLQDINPNYIKTKSTFRSLLNLSSSLAQAIISLAFNLNNLIHVYPQFLVNVVHLIHIPII